MDKIGPIDILRFADDYLCAASCVDEHIGNEPGYEIFAPNPVFYLTGLSIELALKSFLLDNGISLNDLKAKYRHDLIKLLDKSKEYGIEEIVKIDAQDASALLCFNKLFVGEDFRYIKPGEKEVPMFGYLGSFNNRLVHSLCKKFGYKSKCKKWSI